MPQMGSLVEQQGQLETLDRLMRRGLPPNLNVGLPQKVFRKNGAERGRRSRHATPPLPQQRIVSLLVGRLYGITCNLDIIYETEHLDWLDVKHGCRKATLRDEGMTIFRPCQI